MKSHILAALSSKRLFLILTIGLTSTQLLQGAQASDLENGPFEKTVEVLLAEYQENNQTEVRKQEIIKELIQGIDSLGDAFYKTSIKNNRNTVLENVCNACLGIDNGRIWDEVKAHMLKKRKILNKFDQPSGSNRTIIGSIDHKLKEEGSAGVSSLLRHMFGQDVNGQPRFKTLNDQLGNMPKIVAKTGSRNAVKTALEKAYKNPNDPQGYYQHPNREAWINNIRARIAARIQLFLMKPEVVLIPAQYNDGYDQTNPIIAAVDLQTRFMIFFYNDRVKYLEPIEGYHERYELWSFWTLKRAGVRSKLTKADGTKPRNQADNDDGLVDLFATGHLNPKKELKKQNNQSSKPRRR